MTAIVRGGHVLLPERAGRLVAGDVVVALCEPDDLRRELGVLAVRAQRSPAALRAMSAEIRKRKAEITPAG